MIEFLSVDYKGGAFQLFGPEHISALVALAALNIFLLSFKYSSETRKSFLRWILALILVGNEIAWHTWNYSTGRWSIQSMLPLHLCSLLVWALYRVNGT